MSASDVVKDRYLRLRVVDDVLYVCNWFADVVEPDAWHYVARSRPASAPVSGGPELINDDIPTGSAGLLAQYTATAFYDPVREPGVLAL